MYFNIKRDKRENVVYDFDLEIISIENIDFFNIEFGVIVVIVIENVNENKIGEIINEKKVTIVIVTVNIVNFSNFICFVRICL